MQVSYCSYSNFSPQLEQNLDAPSNLAPQLVQNLWAPVYLDVNGDAKADEEESTPMACSAIANARSSRDDCSTKPHI